MDIITDKYPQFKAWLKSKFFTAFRFSVLADNKLPSYAVNHVLATFFFLRRTSNTLRKSLCSWSTLSAPSITSGGGNSCYVCRVQNQYLACAFRARRNQVRVSQGCNPCEGELREVWSAFVPLYFTLELSHG